MYCLKFSNVPIKHLRIHPLYPLILAEDHKNLVIWNMQNQGNPEPWPVYSPNNHGNKERENRRTPPFPANFQCDLHRIICCFGGRNTPLSVLEFTGHSFVRKALVVDPEMIKQTKAAVGGGTRCILS